MSLPPKLAENGNPVLPLMGPDTKLNSALIICPLSVNTVGEPIVIQMVYITHRSCTRYYVIVGNFKIRINNMLLRANRLFPPAVTQDCPATRHSIIRVPSCNHPISDSKMNCAAGRPQRRTGVYDEIPGYLPVAEKPLSLHQTLKVLPLLLVDTKVGPPGLAPPPLVVLVGDGDSQVTVQAPRGQQLAIRRPHAPQPGVLRVDALELAAQKKVHPDMFQRRKVLQDSKLPVRIKSPVWRRSIPANDADVGDEALVRQRKWAAEWLYQ